MDVTEDSPPALALEDLFGIRNAVRGAYLIDGKSYVIALVRGTEKAGYAAVDPATLDADVHGLASLYPPIETESLEDAFNDLVQAYRPGKSLIIAFGSFAYRAYRRILPLIVLAIITGLLWEPGFELLYTIDPSYGTCECTRYVYSTGATCLFHSTLIVVLIPLLYVFQVVCGPFIGSEKTPLSAIARARRIWRQWPTWKRNAAIKSYKPVLRVLAVLSVIVLCGLVLLVPAAAYLLGSQDAGRSAPSPWHEYITRVVNYNTTLLSVYMLKRNITRKWNNHNQEKTTA